MKRTIATTLLAFAQVCGFAQETAVSSPFPTKLDVALTHTELKKPKSFFKYMHVSVSPLPNVGAVPGIGFGFRLISDHSALDLSSIFSGGGHSDAAGLFCTFPKLNYFYYLTPASSSSLYAGGGLALGGLYTASENWQKGSYFSGFIANATVGYEMHRTSVFRSFVQLDVNQPALASDRSGAFPSAWAAVSVGAGF